MSSQRRALDAYSPFELAFIGLVLITAGGLAYAILSPSLTPLSEFLLVVGVTIFLQCSSSFRIQNDVHLVVLIGIACGLMLGVDWWPLQLMLARVASDALRLAGVAAVVLVNPHFAGLQVLLLVPVAGAGSWVGGEIDNACAGLAVLVPTLLLLWLAKPMTSSLHDRLQIGALGVSLVMLGDLARIVIELWLPALGLVPFELVHYPGAFVTGLAGLVTIALAGERWKVTPFQQM